MQDTGEFRTVDQIDGRWKEEKMEKMEDDLIQQSDVISTLRKEKKALSETIAIRNQTIVSLQQEFKNIKQQSPGSGKISVSSGGASETLDLQQHSKEQSKIIFQLKKKIESLERDEDSFGPLHQEAEVSA